MRIKINVNTVEAVFMILLNAITIFVLSILLLCYNHNDHDNRHHHCCSCLMKKSYYVTAFSSDNNILKILSRHNNPSWQRTANNNNHYYPFFGTEKSIIVMDTILSLSSKSIQRNDDLYICRTKIQNNRLSMTFLTMPSSYSHSLSQKKLFNTNNMNHEHLSSKNDVNNNSDITTTIISPKRNIGSFQSWCDQVGIKYSSQYIDFYISDSDDDCTVQLQHDAIAGTVIGIIPSHLLFSSKSIEIEFNDIMNNNENNNTFQLALNYLHERGFTNQISQFYIFIKLLIEYQRKEESIWYLYIQSLPQTFYTSINMNDNEINHLLPPMAYAIATTWKLQYDAFQYAIQLLPDHFEIYNNNITSTSTTTISLSNIKHDIELLKWAYNVVFTRCWSYRDDTMNMKETTTKQNNEIDENNNMRNNTTTTMIHNNNNNRQQRIDLVPFGDMFNHVCNDEEKNIEISYNTNNDCIVTLTKNTKANTSLLFSYGKETNSYHFLTIFGFVDMNQQELLCEIQLSTTTTSTTLDETNHKTNKEQQQQQQQIYKDMYFYDPSKMVFRTNDGAIGMVVWDYILYTLLDQNDMLDVKEQFYQAHLHNDTITKSSIHTQYHLETCILLKRHVDRTIQEMKHLHDKITSSEVHQQHQPEDGNRENYINSRTNRSDMIDLIRTNNEFVTNSFLKVQMRLNRLIQDEMQIRTKRT